MQCHPSAGTAGGRNAGPQKAQSAWEDSKLCEICTQQGLCTLAAARLKASEYQPSSFVDLGSVDTVLQRRSRCDLCRLVASALDEQDCDTEGTVQINLQYRFCSTDRAGSSKQSAQTYTTRGGYRFVPPEATGAIGPAFHYEQDANRKREVREVLAFQACNDALPCISDFSEYKDEELDDCIARSRLSGRILTETVQSSLFKYWLHTCEQSHQDSCRQHIVDSGVPGMFVIDVHEACVVEKPPNCRYVALSYVWGCVSVLRHLKENSALLQTPGALSTLDIPLTIADAVQVVRDIGECFLWVDALCIVQDDLENMQAQIDNMGAIYAHAIFTVVAAHGDNANAGLPGIREGTRRPPQRVLRQNGATVITVIDERDYYSGLSGSYWQTRAWTWQEKLFSSRKLIFSEQQVYWSCKGSTYLEEVCLEGVPDVDFHTDPTNSGPEEPAIPTASVSQEEYHGTYESAVGLFKQRNITMQSDNVRAFTGILNALTASQDDTSIWGIPESVFSYCLGWFMIGSHERNRATTVVVSTNGQGHNMSFPTWTWAAWCGPKSESGNPWLLLNFRPSMEQRWSYIEPEIKYYHVDDPGRLRRVRERWDKLHVLDILEREELRSAWKGQDMFAASPTDEPVDFLPGVNGSLQFCSSVATLQLCQTRLDYKWDPVPSLKKLLEHRVSVWMGDVSHLPRIYIGPASENFEELDPDATEEAVEVDFVIIHRKLGGEFDSSFLSALVVEWIDGVAYRLGCAELRESDWVRLEDREWRRVTLR
ncbi:HET-domain-containing protein [Rhizodiscina lignyota]|uniref:HET-domain-containing protein n=1 Tax=Rhizodiscina lignyota TaxID=1504668 RepID=A0A9P4I7W2_9PEZI|nr:HET-domain-containing protein [Rhizodiscina lignyota]